MIKDVMHPAVSRSTSKRKRPSRQVFRFSSPSAFTSLDDLAEKNEIKQGCSPRGCQGVRMWQFLREMFRRITSIDLYINMKYVFILTVVVVQRIL